MGTPGDTIILSENVENSDIMCGMTCHCVVRQSDGRARNDACEEMEAFRCLADVLWANERGVR